MCGRIGSGLTPPKYGLRSWWISVTRIRPPASRRLSQPAPAPHIGSTRTLMSAARRASRSSVRLRKRSYPSNGSNRSTSPSASASAKGRLGSACPPLAAIPASKTASMSGPAAEPAGDFTLKPLSVHGLWLAVITTPARGAPLDDLVRAHLGRDGAIREDDPDVVSEQHLGRGVREELGRETPVVGDHDALALLPAPDDVARHAIRAAPHVLVRVVLGDAGSPSVRAEDDPGRGRGRRSRAILPAGQAVDERLTAGARTAAPRARRRRVARIPADRPDGEVPVDPLHDQVGGDPRLPIRSPGRRRQHPSAPIALEERVPAAEVAPADVLPARRH